MNQFVDQRPPLNQSKQALSNMLRQRHPNTGVPYNIQQQQQRMQMIQNRGMSPIPRQMMYRARGMGGKPMNNQAMMNQQAAPMNPIVQQAPVNVNMPMQMGNNNPAQAMMNQPTPNPMVNQQMVMGQQNVMQQQVPTNQTIMPGPGSGGIPMQQNPPNMMQQQPQVAGQIMGANMATQQPNQMMQQQGQMGNMGGNQMTQGVSGNQNQMFPNQYQNQMNQSYTGYSNNPQMAANQGNVQAQGQTPMMGNFQQQANPMATSQQRNHQADFLAQQRRNQLMQQQQQQQGQQQTPNVTMNTNMQGNVPPPYRGGKPNMVNPNIQFQELRMRQRAMMTQQQQGEWRVLARVKHLNREIIKLSF